MNSLTNHLINRRKLLKYGSICMSSLIAACTQKSQLSGGNSGSDRVTLATDWTAVAEHGGFYQALATGIYQNHGLDVTIRMGGPQANGTQLLMGGLIDFNMGNPIDAIKAVAEGIPKITVAAIFQKDPQCLIAHPNPDIKTLADLKGKPIYVSPAANVTYWPFLKAKYGFTDDQKRPYNFNPVPFIVDKNSAQQGYITHEPLMIEKQGGFKPLVFLLADYGYLSYAATIETRKELVEKNPDLVQRFVDASIQGWYSYLQNPDPGNSLIKKENPKITDEELAYGLAKFKEYEMILSSEAQKQGIGTMSKERWKLLFESMAELGIYARKLNYQDAFTVQFVNKGVDYYLAESSPNLISQKNGKNQQHIN